METSVAFAFESDATRRRARWSAKRLGTVGRETSARCLGTVGRDVSSRSSLAALTRALTRASRCLSASTRSASSVRSAAARVSASAGKVRADPRAGSFARGRPTRRARASMWRSASAAAGWSARGLDEESAGCDDDEARTGVAVAASGASSRWSPRGVRLGLSSALSAPPRRVMSEYLARASRMRRAFSRLERGLGTPGSRTGDRPYMPPTTRAPKRALPLAAREDAEPDTDRDERKRRRTRATRTARARRKPRWVVVVVLVPVREPSAPRFSAGASSTGCRVFGVPCSRAGSVRSLRPPSFASRLELQLAFSSLPPSFPPLGSLALGDGTRT